MPNYKVFRGRRTIYSIHYLGLIVSLFFVVSCNNGYSDSSLIKVTEGQSKIIYEDMIGLNGNLTALDRPWENENLVEAVRNLNVGNVRYPAGSLGNYWDWDRGWLDQSVPDSLMIKWVYERGLTKSDKTYTLENFALGHRKLGFTPVFMLNMLSKDLDHSVRNLLKARELGLPIKYIELGNELYFDLPFEKKIFPTPEAYGQTCRIWIDSLKTHFPDAKYAIIGNYLERHQRQVDWTRRALKHCPNADAVTFHKYSPAGIDGQQERKSITAGTEGLSDLLSATRKAPSEDLTEVQKWQLELLKKDSAYANYLNTAAHAARYYEKLLAPDSLEIWATEFNMRDDKSALRGTWSNSLYISKYYEEFLNGPITLTNIHNVTGDLFKQIFTEDNQLHHIVGRSLTTTPWKMSASGIATHVFARATSGMTQVSTLDFSDTRALTDDRGASCPMLAGWIFQSEGSRKILLVNYSKNGVILDLSDFPGFSSASEYSSLPDKYITSGLEDISISEKKMSSKFQLSPYSFTIIE